MLVMLGTSDLDEEGRMAMKRASVAVAAAATVTALLSGCSGAGNDGGDTTCRAFLATNDNDKDATVAKMLKGRNARNASTGDVERLRMTLAGLCQPADKQDSKIGDLA
jgi:acid stress chaperone HdeA